jgi:hypothetical protein
MGIKERLVTSLKELIEKDLKLIELGASERSLTHRLAIYIEKQFPDYECDCEFNRAGVGTPKRVNGLNVASAYPDIIVHLRGTNASNLLVIEVKKEGVNNSEDRLKLVQYIREYGYQYAFLITIPSFTSVSSLENYVVRINPG